MTLLPDEPMAVLTNRQKTALKHLTTEATRHGLSGCHDYSWDFAFDPESRPGRGRDVRIWFCDGEKVATATIDVYGAFRGPEIGSVDWECAADPDAGLDCPLCPDDDEPWEPDPDDPNAHWIRPR